MKKDTKTPKSRARRSLNEYKTLLTKENALLVLRQLWKWAILPSLIYGVIFFVTQPHYWMKFSTEFYIDKGDGFQNIWNIWWVNHSVGQGKSPYFTTMLHWPHGVSLLPQTMNIINGLMGIPLINWLGLSLVQTTNVIILLTYIGSGVTMLWFVFKLVGKYWPAIIAGALFTFSTYHLAHGKGHMQLMTMQYIPLFLLAFWLLVQKMRYRYAVLAALALFLVLLSDYYYFFWSVLLGAMYVGWQLYRKELKVNAQNIKVMAVFAILSLALTLPLVRALLHLNKVDPLLGAHDAAMFSLDPLTIFIPGGTWQWAELTSWHWKHLAFSAETSVFFGYALLALLAIAFARTFFYKKKEFKAPKWLNFWWIVLFVFGLLSLGPHPYTFGRSLESIPLPYFFLESIFPTLKLSGMPVRWILISLMAAIIIGAYMLARLDLKTQKGRALLAIFIAVTFIDLAPMNLPITNAADSTPPYVHHLKTLPTGAVIDNAATTDADQLFHQTTHLKPMAFGYITRLPQSVSDKDFHIFAALEQGRHDDLCTVYRVRYITTPAFRPLKTTYPVIYNDGKSLIYDFKNSPNC